MQPLLTPLVTFLVDLLSFLLIHSQVFTENLSSESVMGPWEEQHKTWCPTCFFCPAGRCLDLIPLPFTVPADLHSPSTFNSWMVALPDNLCPYWKVTYKSIAFLANTTAASTPTQRGRCDRFEFECHQPKKCIPNWKRCDGHQDCQDGQDEANCREYLLKVTLQSSGSRSLLPSLGSWLLCVSVWSCLQYSLRIGWGGQASRSVIVTLDLINLPNVKY